jgi:hypothetical protein
MMQRILNSKNHVAFVLTAATGMTLYSLAPFPEDNIFLRVMALRSPSAFEVLKYSYTLFLFSTPYVGYSVVLSGLYIFALKARQRIRAARLPLFPEPRKRDELFLVVGEVHNPGKKSPPRGRSGSSSPRGVCSMVFRSSAKSGQPTFKRAIET